MREYLCVSASMRKIFISASFASFSMFLNVSICSVLLAGGFASAVEVESCLSEQYPVFRGRRE